jgi:hypothetical protein
LSSVIPLWLVEEMRSRLDGIIVPKVTPLLRKINRIPFGTAVSANNPRIIAFRKQRITNRNNPQLPFFEWH